MPSANESKDDPAWFLCAYVNYDLTMFHEHHVVRSAGAY